MCETSLPLTFCRVQYRIEGKFYMVQTFAVFADNPTTAQLKTAISFNSPVGTAPCRALSQK